MFALRGLVEKSSDGQEELQVIRRDQVVLHEEVRSGGEEVCEGRAGRVQGQRPW